MTILDHSDYLNKNREKIIKADLLQEHIIDFYQSLFDFQKSRYLEFKDMDTEILKEKNDSLPVLESHQLDFPETLQPFLDNALKELLEIIENYQKDFRFDTLESMLHSDYSLYLQLVKELMDRDYDSLEKTATTAKTGLEGLLFVVINLFKPVFIALREIHMIEYDTPDWTEPVCPFCGFLPDMAKIVSSKDNKRLLHCALCENEWQFKRVCCTVCGNQDVETLGFFIYEENELYRFDYCEKCKGYIKTLHIPEQFDDSRYNLTVENIITSFLDASAIDMGYKKP